MSMQNCQNTAKHTANASQHGALDAIPVIPSETQVTIGLKQPVTFLKCQVCVYKMYSMHDGHQVCYPALLSNLLVYVGSTD